MLTKVFQQQVVYCRSLCWRAFLINCVKPRTMILLLQCLGHATVLLLNCCSCSTNSFSWGGDRNSQSSNHSISFIRVSADRGRERPRESEWEGEGGEDAADECTSKLRTEQLFCMVAESGGSCLFSANMDDSINFPPTTFSLTPGLTIQLSDRLGWD